MTLATLKRVAEALDCTLVHAQVTNQSLGVTAGKAAMSAAKKELAAAFHTMALQGKDLPGAGRHETVEERALTTPSTRHSVKRPSAGTMRTD